VVSYALVAASRVRPLPAARLSTAALAGTAMAPHEGMSRVETHRAPHGAAGGIARTGAAPPGCLALSLRKFHTTWGLRRAVVMTTAAPGHAGSGTGWRRAGVW